MHIFTEGVHLLFMYIFTLPLSAVTLQLTLANVGNLFLTIGLLMIPHKYGKPFWFSGASSLFNDDGRAD